MVGVVGVGWPGGVRTAACDVISDWPGERERVKAEVAGGVTSGRGTLFGGWEDE